MSPCCAGRNASQHNFTFTVSNDAPSRITTSRLSAIRSWRLRRCFAALGSYSSKCSRPRFLPLAAAMMYAFSSCPVACCRRHRIECAFTNECLFLTFWISKLPWWVLKIILNVFHYYLNIYTKTDHFFSLFSNLSVCRARPCVTAVRRMFSHSV